MGTISNKIIIKVEEALEKTKSVSSVLSEKRLEDFVKELKKK